MAPGLPAGSALYVRSRCGASRAASLARVNLHLEDLAVKNESEDATARDAHARASGGGQAPCLVAEGEAILESDAIIARLVEAAAPIG